MICFLHKKSPQKKSSPSESMENRNNWWWWRYSACLKTRFTKYWVSGAKNWIQLIKENPDTAILFLDVVMEKDNSGLKVAKTIREELNNNFIWIVLRTGQPGMAPELQGETGTYRWQTLYNGYFVITGPWRTYADWTQPTGSTTSDFISRKTFLS